MSLISVLQFGQVMVGSFIGVMLKPSGRKRIAPFYSANPLVRITPGSGLNRRLK